MILEARVEKVHMMDINRIIALVRVGTMMMTGAMVMTKTSPYESV
jgi:hypothetical protein